jgi:hypothetical protein
VVSHEVYLLFPPGVKGVGTQRVRVTVHIGE